MINFSTFSILLLVFILLLGMGTITWMVLQKMEKRLERARASEVGLRKDFDLTLEAWAKVLEYREKESKGHSHRLIELSARLAEALGLTEEEIGHLRRGVLVHDIGKLVIPDEILLKPGSLNNVERKLLEQHPVYAKQMLSPIAFLAPAVEVAYSHHERWDGLGYPERLKGKEIPLSARIFTVVEQWDALTSDRPYRKAWTRDSVIVYFQENAGKIYDPEIVEVFLMII